MPRLILILALLLAAWLAIRWFVRTPPRQVITTLQRLGLAVLVLGLAFLTASGRLNWIVATGAALLPLLRRGWVLLRYLPFLRGLFGRYQATKAARGPTVGQSSSVETRFVRMTLDHDSGDMDGEVLEGGFEGRLLSQMSLADLLDLYAQCQEEDPDSEQLLAAYLDRTRPRWRAQADATQRPAAEPGGVMTAEEAREILGVAKDASEAEIIHAHRKLMHKLHPDRGGSDYLAAKVNLAKDCLLGELSR